MTHDALVRFSLRVGAETAEEVQEYLCHVARHGWEETEEGNHVRFTFHLDDHPLADSVREEALLRWPDARLEVSSEDRQDWGRAWMEFFTPVTAGEHFEILPPWLEHEARRDRTTIVIEPKMAFGTGHHPSTALCLEVLGDLLAQDDSTLGAQNRFLDLGTGSGILAVGLALKGLFGLALDIDPQAVVCARENVIGNQVADRVSLAVGSLDTLPQDARFEVIVANILSGPLIAMAPQLCSHLAPGARLVLSGILSEQAPDVARAYRSQGLGTPEILRMDEWVALCW